tara:strand:- start:3387 stop:5552 length:2166 start_codon:yes stop_codon:yes gene_type:complete
LKRIALILVPLLALLVWWVVGGSGVQPELASPGQTPDVLRPSEDLPGIEWTGADIEPEGTAESGTDTQRSQAIQRSGPFRLRVVDGFGNGLDHAEVNLVLDDGSKRAFSGNNVNPSEKGWFVLSIPKPVSAMLDVRVPTFDPHRESARGMVDGADPRIVTLTYGRALEVLVVDDQGHAVEGVEVQAVQVEEEATDVAWGPRDAQTNEEGRARLVDLPAVATTLRVTASLPNASHPPRIAERTPLPRNTQGWITAVRTFDVPAAPAPMDPIRLMIEQGTSLEIHFENPVGPDATARVWLMPSTHAAEHRLIDRNRDAVPSSARRGRESSAAFSRLQKDVPYDVIVEVGGTILARDTVVVTGQKGQEWSLHDRGVSEGTIEILGLPDALQVRNLILEAKDGRPSLGTMTDPNFRGQGPRTFQIKTVGNSWPHAGLEVGRYHATTRDAKGGIVAEGDIEVPSAHGWTAILFANPDEVLHGVLTDQSGTPLPSWRVFTSLEADEAQVMTGKDGSFSLFADLGDAAHRLWAQSPAGCVALLAEEVKPSRKPVTYPLDLKDVLVTIRSQSSTAPLAGTLMGSSASQNEVLTSVTGHPVEATRPGTRVRVPEGRWTLVAEVNRVRTLPHVVDTSEADTLNVTLLLLPLRILMVDRGEDWPGGFLHWTTKVDGVTCQGRVHVPAGDGPIRVREQVPTGSLEWTHDVGRSVPLTWMSESVVGDPIVIPEE